ncbi:ABC transporter permease [Halomicroarcula sp. GCM10025709]|uniref:ABC transporter permease n=1 Tax=Haloarcula TaxID=2237 RepID=UPI0024C42BB1|nr:ABC transporter permease [Halomicroarcula sp. YJ-61-S]
MSSSEAIDQGRFDRRPLTAAKGFLRAHIKELLVGYPLAMLLVFFVLPSAYLVVVSFFPKPAGEFYSVGFTLANYGQLLESPIYLDYLLKTLEFAGITAVLSTAMGYPVAYWIARVDSELKRQVYLLTIIASMWLTVIIRAYAIKVVFAGNGLFNQALQAGGVIEEPITGGNGYLTVVLGMLYGFLPFAILTMYTSVKNIDPELEQASRNLGASKLRTIREVTLPLSRNGIVASAALVFILSIGSYAVPMLLGNPSEWTLPVIITNTVRDQLNVPFGSVLAIVMTLLIVVLFWASVRYLGLGSEQLVGDAPEEEADG